MRLIHIKRNMIDCETCHILEKDFVHLVKEGEEKKDFDFKDIAIKKCEDKNVR